MLTELREWTNLLLELGIFLYVAAEYHYDKNKDLAKKQKRTKTMKKTTTNKDGSNVVEESTENIEPVIEEKK